MPNNHQDNLWFDNSTYANFAQWASGISARVSGGGFVQSNDGGQVIWTASVVNITAVTVTGTTAVYTYTLTSGPALRIGMGITIAGAGGTPVSAGNQCPTATCTGKITALGTGTFTLTITSGGVTESGKAGTGTVLASTTTPIFVATSLIPAACDIAFLNYRGGWVSGTSYVVNDTVSYSDGNTYICKSASSSDNPTVTTTWSPFNYEMWKSNDGLTDYYARLEYGTRQDAGSGNLIPGMAATLLNSTNGSGAQGRSSTSGLTTRLIFGYVNATNDLSAANECDFYSGTTHPKGIGSLTGTNFICALWRLSPNAHTGWAFGWERSIDNTGTYTSEYVTLLGITTPATSGNSTQQSLKLSNGQAGVFDTLWGSVQMNSTTSSWAVNGSIAISPVFPNVGRFGNPLTIAAVARFGDAIEGTSVPVVNYATTMSYLAIRGNGSWTNTITAPAVGILLMRNDASL